MRNRPIFFFVCNDFGIHLWYTASRRPKTSFLFHFTYFDKGTGDKIQKAQTCGETE